MVSVGSTGATMAAATFGLRRLKACSGRRSRCSIPFAGKPVLFLDVGANVEVRAQHLVQFAFLGAAFSAAVLGVASPRVGLLTGRRGGGQGPHEVVEAHRMLAEAPGIEFAGNVEGRDLPEAKVDVVVTDGFTGNVALKVMEGAARDGGRGDLRPRPPNPLAAAGGLLLRPALGGLRREFTPTRPAARSCSGCARIAVVGHGCSGAEGIANAVRLAAATVKVDAVGRTAALLREGHAGRVRAGR